MGFGSTNRIVYFGGHPATILLTRSELEVIQIVGQKVGTGIDF